MADRWFRVPVTGDGTMDDPIRPKHADRVDGFAWTDRGVFSSSPRRLARFYSDDTVLDDIAAESDVQEVSLPVDSLNNAFGQSRDADGWREGFHIS